MTPRLPGNPKNIFDASVLTKFSDLESRRDAIINMAKNKANAPHTILLVGGTGVGRSSFMGFIANALLGRDDDYYDLFISDRASHVYEIASELGILVSAYVLNAVIGHNLSPRFVSSTRTGSPALTVLSTTSS